MDVEIEIGCPSCAALCVLTVKPRDDGWYTGDTCFRCGTDLPPIRLVGFVITSG